MYCMNECKTKMSEAHEWIRLKSEGGRAVWCMNNRLNETETETETDLTRAHTTTLGSTCNRKNHAHHPVSSSARVLMEERTYSNIAKVFVRTTIIRLVAGKHSPSCPRDGGHWSQARKRGVSPHCRAKKLPLSLRHSLGAGGWQDIKNRRGSVWSPTGWWHTSTGDVHLHDKFADRRSPPLSLTPAASTNQSPTHAPCTVTLALSQAGRSSLVFGCGRMGYQ